MISLYIAKKFRILAAALVLVVVAGVTACSSNTGGNNTATNPPATDASAAAGTDAVTATDAPADTSAAPADKYATLSNPNISIVYWMSEDAYAQTQAQNPNYYDPILGAIPAFEAKYGGKVNLIVTDWNSMMEQTVALQNSGQAPDLVEVYDRDMYSSVVQNILQPLDSVVGDEDYSFYNVSRSLFSWKGQTYAIPIKPYVQYIMYNKDMFDMAGLEYPDDLFLNGQWTFDKFAEVGQKLVQTKDGQVTQWGFSTWQDCLTTFFLQNGGSLVNVDQSAGTITSGLDSPQTQSVLNTLVDWYTQPGGFIIFDGTDNISMWSLFDNNQLGMIRGKELPADEPFDVGVAPYPSGPDAPVGTIYAYPQAFGVPTGSTNAEGAAAFMYCVNEQQKAVGDPMMENLFGQKDYDMLFGPDVNYTYSYDKDFANVDQIIGSIWNYLDDKTPAATIAQSVDPLIQAGVAQTYGGQ